MPPKFPRMDRDEAAIRAEYERHIFSLLQRAAAEKSRNGIATSWVSVAPATRRDDETTPN